MRSVIASSVLTKSAFLYMYLWLIFICISLCLHECLYAYMHVLSDYILLGWRGLCFNAFHVAVYIFVSVWLHCASVYYILCMHILCLVCKYANMLCLRLFHICVCMCVLLCISVFMIFVGLWVCVYLCSQAGLTCMDFLFALLLPSSSAKPKVHMHIGDLN